jgi:hypothetical protein
MSSMPAPSVITDSGRSRARTSARPADTGRPVRSSRTRICITRSPGVCPVVDQNTTKYPTPQMSAIAAPMATNAVWTSFGRSNSDSPSPTTTPTSRAIALMTAALAANATTRVTKPA